MTRRDVVRLVLEGKRPPYVPWSMGFTKEAKEKLQRHYGCDDVEVPLENHLLKLGSDIGFFTDLGNNRVRDVFGVVWDRSVDKDIGNVEGLVLPEPTLAGYRFPDPLDRRFFADIPAKIDRFPDRFRVFQIGFSLYERAWTLRGMENLMIDFHDHPAFVHELLGAIADYNIAQVREALKYDIDAVYFGDDWGQQRGLQMGPRTVARVHPAATAADVRRGARGGQVRHDPLLRRRRRTVRRPGRRRAELLQSLPARGDGRLRAACRRYRGRLAFHGGLSTQKTLPFGTPDDVRRETRRLLELGRDGGYIFAPAHDVEGDVPLENMLAAIETVQRQPEYLRIGTPPLQNHAPTILRSITMNKSAINRTGHWPSFGLIATVDARPHTPRTPKLPPMKPLFDYPLRDTSICVGGDGMYYLTGTTGDIPTWWTDQRRRIRVWKSADLKTWEPLGAGLEDRPGHVAEGQARRQPRPLGPGDPLHQGNLLAHALHELRRHGLAEEHQRQGRRALRRRASRKAR